MRHPTRNESTLSDRVHNSHKDNCAHRSDERPKCPVDEHDNSNPFVLLYGTQSFVLNRLYSTVVQVSASLPQRYAGSRCESEAITRMSEYIDSVDLTCGDKR